MKTTILSWFDADDSYSQYGARARTFTLSVCSRSVLRRAKTAATFLAACVTAANTVSAAPSSVERFDIAAWEHLQKELPRPSAVVFTATYCTSCPAVLAQLSRTLKEQGIKSDLVAVVIDEASKGELLNSQHYDHASRLFLFEGNELALRYNVDPRWRGVTPYTALLPVKGKAVFVTGIPSDAQIASWLAH